MRRLKRVCMDVFVCLRYNPAHIHTLTPSRKGAVSYPRGGEVRFSFMCERESVNCSLLAFRMLELSDLEAP